MTSKEKLGTCLISLPFVMTFIIGGITHGFLAILLTYLLVFGTLLVVIYGCYLLNDEDSNDE